jgi:hypothetical protein
VTRYKPSNYALIRRATRRNNGFGTLAGKPDRAANRCKPDGMMKKNSPRAV